MTPPEEENTILSDSNESTEDSQDGSDESAGEDAIDDLFGNDDSPVAEATIISDDTGSSEINSGDSEEENDLISKEEEGAEGIDAVSDEEDGEEATRTAVNGFLQYTKYAVGFALGSAFVFVLAISGFLPGEDDGEIEADPVIQVYIASIEGDTADVFFFDRFLVLLEDGTERAYLLLNLSVIPSNGNVYREVKRKRVLCRNVIFSVLKNTVKESREIMGAKLKVKIKDALNGMLVSGHIDNISFGEFIIV